MKKILFCLFLMLLNLSVGFSQIFSPIKWTFSSKDLGNNEYLLSFQANIDKGWHLYSQHLPDGGPIPTSFTFEPTQGLTRISTVKEPQAHKEFDKSFNMELAWFSQKALFTQKVKISQDVVLKGSLEFMACDDEKCLPPESVEFSFALKHQAGLPTSSPTHSTPSEVTQATIDTPQTPSAVPSDSASTPSTAATYPPHFEYYKPKIAQNTPQSSCEVSQESVKNQSLITIFILGFLGGLLALLTPCVFPMIPLTVSYFTKDSSGNGLINAFLYGFFILAVYLLLSIPFHLLDSIDPNILNTISTNTYLNVAFFVVFIVFAISFFGYFEITLPSTLANKADSASNVGGILGIFFMALTLAVVSFSCTGPILGSLLAGSLTSNGGAIQLTAGMAGFGFALALPFALFAAFPSWLNNVPKSGGWLSDVKVLLGFIEVALAFKFLSNADLVEHWNILPYELFIGIWLLIAILIVLYLLNLLRFSHSTPFKKWSVLRVLLLGTFIAAAGYLSTAYTYNSNTKTFQSLSVLSGLAPPSGYSWIYPNHCPLNLNCFHDYNEGLAYAKKVNKPIMLDFTGWACVNCRKMEENVWSDPAIYKLIQEHYVLISLYVDDRKALPVDEQHTYQTQNGSTKKIKTIGHKWATFQTETFQNNSQPWYPLLSPNEDLLLSPIGNTPEINKFRAYLECGINALKTP